MSHCRSGLHLNRTCGKATMNIKSKQRPLGQLKIKVGSTLHWNIQRWQMVQSVLRLHMSMPTCFSESPADRGCDWLTEAIYMPVLVFLRAVDRHKVTKRLMLNSPFVNINQKTSLVLVTFLEFSWMTHFLTCDMTRYTTATLIWPISFCVPDTYLRVRAMVDEGGCVDVWGADRVNQVSINITGTESNTAGNFLWLFLLAWTTNLLGKWYKPWYHLEWKVHALIWTDTIVWEYLAIYTLEK